MQQPIPPARLLLLLLGLALSGCAGAGSVRAKQGSTQAGQAPAPVTTGAASAGAAAGEPDAASIAIWITGKGGLTDCYSKALRTTNKTGKTVLQFAVLPDGSVAGAKILESTFDDEATSACMVERLSKLKTPFRPTIPKVLRMPISIQ